MQNANKGTSVSLTIPLNITISLGDTSQGQSVLGVSPASITLPMETLAAATVADEITIDQNWSDRKGYDPHFLGFSVPLPQLHPDQQADTVAVQTQYQVPGDPNLLNYHHYSLKMSHSRRMAWFSAAMIDGARFINFARGQDQWFLDPRIAADEQLGEDVYSAAHTDHGHLTRFKDLSWGADKTEAVNATNDSFHYTNCTPQLDKFNESQDRWQGLEQFLLEQHAKPEKRQMVVITGPVLKATDPKYKNPAMSVPIQVPLAFWKVCVLSRKDGSTAATGFTLGQEDITKLPGFEARLDIATAQVTIADLEKLTNLDFGDLRNHDVFAQTGQTGILEALRPDGTKARVLPISDFSEIVI